MDNCLIIFTRYPEAGKAKTRLIPALGAAGAAELHRQMTEAAIAQAKRLRETVDIVVYFTGATTEQMQQWLGSELLYRSQGAGDLGDRLTQAFQTAFDQGYRSVVTIGTDCPALSVDVLSTAFQSLVEKDVVLGATTDGGYYLVGLRCPVPELFADIAWSTEVVFQQTIAIAQNLKLEIAHLPILSDIDRPEDLGLLSNFRSAISINLKLK